MINKRHYSVNFGEIYPLSEAVLNSNFTLIWGDSRDLKLSHFRFLTVTLHIFQIIFFSFGQFLIQIWMNLYFPMYNYISSYQACQRWQWFVVGRSH